MMDAEEFLMHHGVEGMHWGVRKEKLDKVKPTRPGAVRNYSIFLALTAAGILFINSRENRTLKSLLIRTLK